MYLIRSGVTHRAGPRAPVGISIDLTSALMSKTPGTQEILARFDPISLAEMDGVKLLSRTDTKYAFHEDDLPRLLQALLPDYRLLEVDGERGVRYRSLYFDTPDLKHFLEHHNGRVFRSKTRFREYIGSGLCFLEVKRKTGRGGTDKVRRQEAAIPERLNAEQQAFIAGAIGSNEPMHAVLWNHFTRLTLVHRTRPERLTIDRGLRFSTPDGSAALEGICVAELKESRADRGSPFAALMKASGNRPSGMSKYCVGMLLLGLAPKHNAFKPVLRHLEHLRRARPSDRRAA